MAQHRAVRGADGRWRVDECARSQVWITTAPFTAMPPREAVLSPQMGRRIDAILADPCFAAEPTRIDAVPADRPPPCGLSVRTPEATAPGLARTATLFGPAGGLTAELECLLQP